MSLASFACSGPGLVYVTGDAAAIGTEIEVDGRKIGVMESHEYVGSKSTDPTIINREQELLARLGLRPGEKFAFVRVTVPQGTREIAFKTPTGRSLRRVIEVTAETYVNVRAEAGIIEN